MGTTSLNSLDVFDEPWK